MTRKKKQQTPAEVAAPRGERMIQFEVRLWTDQIAPTKGHVIPKHAQASGVVQFQANGLHGISPGKPVPFHSMLDLGRAIEEMLIKHGVVLVPGRQERKYRSELRVSETE